MRSLFKQGALVCVSALWMASCISTSKASPRPYTRMYQLTGTKGFANKYPLEGYALDGKDLPPDMQAWYGDITTHEYMPEAAKTALIEKYKDPIVKELEQKAREVGEHGGMGLLSNIIFVWRVCQNLVVT